jgi:TonB-dependent SusC/RagA subfamily outer membrane receptor
MTTRYFTALCCASGLVLLSACSHGNTRERADSPRIDEQEVSHGYGTETRGTSTAAIGSITRADVEETRATHVEELLRGRLAGVDVVRKPDGDFTVRIRGTRSLMGGNDPLFVIDGMPVHATGFMGALTGISPHAIERIEILKSAGSLAAYGSRGANGVVLITTKRAQ